LPTPNQRIAIGVHAIGGIGRMLSTRGRTMSESISDQPSATPSTMPTSAASRNPVEHASQAGKRVLPKDAFGHQVIGGRDKLQRRRQQHRVDPAEAREQLPQPEEDDESRYVPNGR
jgi:hypothetical protein